MNFLAFPRNSGIQTFFVECPANGGPGPSKRSKGTKAPRSSRSGTKSTGTKKGKRDLKTKSGMFGAPDAF